MAWSRNMTWDPYFEVPQEFTELYLTKLGLKRQAPSKAYLEELVRQQLLTVPFETLNTTDIGLPVRIDPLSLMTKLLKQPRGGFCFELNGAFSLLLKALGFDAWLCPCRPLRHHEATPVPATHCALLINLADKTYYADVGFGGPTPFGCLEFKTDDWQTVHGETYCFQASGITPDDPTSDPARSGWYTLVRRSQRQGTRLAIMQVAPIQQYLCDFYGQTQLRASGDSAYAVRHVALRYPDGYADLTGTTLKVQHGEDRQVSEITEGELPAVLRQYFGIVISA
ncbi:arylamine N-acetyltransferase family protein [Lacticaseibacillus sp. GG6-2]